MAVNETGKERGIAKVDDLRASGQSDSRASASYPFALDNNRDTAFHFPGLHVKHAGGTKHNDFWRRALLGAQAKGKESKDEDPQRAHGAAHGNLQSLIFGTAE
jgi:hypothetical protein